MWHQTQIVGNVGRAPEMKYTPTGTAVTNFSVAVNEQYKTASGEQVKHTIWYRVSTFGKQAEIVNQYVKKGMLVFVSGRMTADSETGGPRVWISKNGGAPASSFEIKAHEVKFLSRVGSAGDSEGEPAEVEVPF